MGNDALLIPAVQALDQGDIETAPERLERVWRALAPHRDGTAQKGFHAAEEMLLRWLLKVMNGSGDVPERFRRFPRAWEILRIVFDWIPLFSLAKALADRRFMVILQQTLKEISTPNGAAAETNGDVEMVDAVSDRDPTFDLALQRQKSGCLKSAQAVLSALRVLITRCESVPITEPPSRRMGAEHVKSLFYSSASDAMKLLVPIIMLCGLAAGNHDQGDYESAEQISWMSTFTSLWELHLRGPGDALEVASNLSGFAASLLGRLTGLPEQRSLAIDPAVQHRWAQDLRLFLMRNMVLPSRSASIDKQGAPIAQQIMQTAVEMSSANFTTSFPVLFDLISKTPRTLGGMTSKKDYETWVQSTFDALISALKPHGKQALPAVETILEMAAEQDSPLSLPALREICKDYALQADGFAWRLLFSIIKLNPDVFLISSEGQELLDQILEKTRNSESMRDEDFDKALQFVVLLAERYARARDLSTFLKTWLRYLAVGETKVKLERLWSRKELVSAVASVMQESLNTKQLVDIIEWLSTRTSPAESLGRIHILAAISCGISDEELIDATNMKTFNTAFLEKFSKKEPSTIAVSRWLIAENAISRGTQEEAGQIWTQVRSDIERTLKKSTITKEGTFAAFKCAVSAWIANYPCGPHEREAASTICAFVERLDQGTESEQTTADHPVTKGTYMSWMLTGDSRLVTLIAKMNKQFPGLVLGLLLPEGGASSSSSSSNLVTLDTAKSVISQLLDNDNMLNDGQVSHSLIDKMIQQFDPSKASPETLLARKIAVQFLLGIPDEIFTRPHREAVMERLVSRLPETKDLAAEDEIEYWRPVLSLMRKVMDQPTFYADMNYGHLDKIGKRLYKLSSQTKEWKSSDGVLRVRDVFLLLGQLALLTIQQMDSGNPEEREKGYLQEAASLLQSSCKESEAVTRLVLLHAFISGLRESSNLDKLGRLGPVIEDLKKRLVEEVKTIMELGKWRGKTLLSLLIALKTTDVLDRQAIRESLSSALPFLVKASRKYLQKNSQAGWEIRMFLARYFPEKMGSPLKLRFLAQDVGDGEDEEEGAGSPALVDRATLLQYVDVVVRDIDDEAKMAYLEELLAEQGEDRVEECYRLFIVRTLVQHLAVTRGAAITSKSGFELAHAHTILCNKLLQAADKDPEQFVLVAETLHILLDQKGVCMIQWNIDNTLGTVAAICANLDQSLSQKHSSLEATGVALLPKTYKYLCALVEIIIKRHRKRIDGHFHLLIPTLQALLRHLLILSSNPSGSRSGKKPPTSPLGTVTVAQKHKQQEKNARLYSRLLTLVCEPTVASVWSTRSGPQQQQNNQTEDHQRPNVILDVEKDKAKRYAGQFMYLVVMHYIRLQLQLEQTVVVTGEAREALEAGMFSILDITSKPDGLRIMTDAMDSSGRVILRELLRRYERFGKWSGV